MEIRNIQANHTQYMLSMLCLLRIVYEFHTFIWSLDFTQILTLKVLTDFHHLSKLELGSLKLRQW